MDARTVQLAALGMGAVAVAAVAFKLITEAKAVGGAVVDTAAGVLTGNNAITQNQTNAAGEKTTAYEGAGVLGTVGAATNSMSGGVFASWGENLGGWFYDATHFDWTAEAQAAAPPASGWTPPPVNTGSISGSW